MIPICCPETSVRNYHSTLRKIPEERKSHLHRFGSLKSSESSLPFPFEPATAPYSVPDKSNLHIHTRPFKICFNINFPSTPRSSKRSLPFTFPHRMGSAFLISPMHGFCVVQFVLSYTTVPKILHCVLIYKLLTPLICSF
jgi:hypothetical protein